MKQIPLVRIFLMILLSFTMAITQARTGYVNDIVEVTLRTGESTKNSIIRMLPSGEKLNVLSVNDDTGYAKVITADGKDGFVISRFVTYEPIARDKLVSANRRLERAAQKVGELEAELRDIKGQNSNYSQSQGSLEADNARLTDELAEIRRTAANALQIADENRTLKSRQGILETQIQDLQSRNTVLSARSRQSWYLAGAGTLIVGILAGLILPRINLKKRSRWGEL